MRTVRITVKKEKDTQVTEMKNVWSISFEKNFVLIQCKGGKYYFKNSIVLEIEDKGKKED